MAYDPKKKRPKTKSLDSVVDEIFGEEDNLTETKGKAAAKPQPKKPKSTTSKSSKATAEKPASPKKKTSSSNSSQSRPKTSKANLELEKEEARDNVIPLRPENQETPLIMQPQVWIASAIAAILLLVFIKKRK